MDETTLQRRIRERLGDLKLSPRKASLRAGLGPDAIRIILDGRSLSPRAERLQAIAQVLETDVAWLLGEAPVPYESMAINTDRVQRSTLAGVSSIQLPVIHEVAAGAWRAEDEVRQDEPYGYYEAVVEPEYQDVRQWLELVRGQSMTRLGLTDGALVHVLDAIDLRYQPRHGDLVIVVRTRAQGAFVERSVKQVELTPTGVQLWGRSYDERYNVPLSLIDAELVTRHRSPALGRTTCRWMSPPSARPWSWPYSAKSTTIAATPTPT